MEQSQNYDKNDEQENQDDSSVKNDRIFEDDIKPFDFGFERSSAFASMDLEFTNSYRFQPSTSYMRDNTVDYNSYNSSLAGSMHDTQNTFGSPSKYSKQVRLFES